MRPRAEAVAPVAAAHGAFVQAAINGTSTMSLVVPNNPALVGFQLTAQSTCASSNALGFSTSNGLRATAGY